MGDEQFEHRSVKCAVVGRIDRGLMATVPDRLRFKEFRGSILISAELIFTGYT